MLNPALNRFMGQHLTKLVRKRDSSTLDGKRYCVQSECSTAFNSVSNTKIQSNCKSSQRTRKLSKKTKDQVAANKSAEPVKSRNPSETSGVLTGHEATLWVAANALQGQWILPNTTMCSLPVVVLVLPKK